MWSNGEEEAGRICVQYVYVCDSTERNREEGCVQLCVIILYEDEETGKMCAAMCDYTV